MLSEEEKRLLEKSGEIEELNSSFSFDDLELEEV